MVSSMGDLALQMASTMPVDHQARPLPGCRDSTARFGLPHGIRDTCPCPWGYESPRGLVKVPK